MEITAIHAYWLLSQVSLIHTSQELVLSSPSPLLTRLYPKCANLCKIILYISEGPFVVTELRNLLENVLPASSVE